MPGETVPAERAGLKSAKPRIYATLGPYGWVWNVSTDFGPPNNYFAWKSAVANVRRQLVRPTCWNCGGPQDWASDGQLQVLCYRCGRNLPRAPK